MNKERIHLTLAETHGLDVKKVMDNIEYLDAIVDSCDDKSVLEMHKTLSSLYWISDRELIKLSEFRTANQRLEEIGKKFLKKCDCIKTITLD